MKVLAIIAIFVIGSEQIIARDVRLKENCLLGLSDRNKCCEGIPDSWFAHLKNPEDCGSFFQCENGKPTWKACPEGLEWSVAHDRCDWPRSANCTVNSKHNQESNTASTQSGSTSTQTYTPISTTQGPPLVNAPLVEEDECGPEPVCRQCLTGIIPVELCCTGVKTYYKLQLANIKNCSSYYQCVNNHAVLRECPKGLHWSVNTDRCEWPAVAKCKANNDQGQNHNGQNNGNDDSNKGNGVVSNDCLYGKISAKICCKSVPYWVDVLLQNNGDCHTHFQCVHGKPMVRPCPANLWWSVTANRCEWKPNATCTW